MASFLTVPLALVALALLTYGVLLYNALVSARNNCDRAWANVDVILMQRNDEVPNLVATVKAYAAHEKSLLETVTEARATIAAHPSVPQMAAASAQLSESVTRLFAIAEAYPDLKANENFLALQKRLSSLEDVLADRREFFNESIATYNTRIQEFPEALLARRLGFTGRDYFQADGAARFVPVVT